MKYTLETHHRKLLVDTMTPVNMYLKIRDKYPNSILLESSDYGVNDNSVAYICFNPIAEIKLQNHILKMSYPDGTTKELELAENDRVAKHCSSFAKQFSSNFQSDRFVSNGRLVSLLMMQFSILRIFGFQKKIKIYLFHNCIMLSFRM